MFSSQEWHSAWSAAAVLNFISLKQPGYFLLTRYFHPDIFFFLDPSLEITTMPHSKSLKSQFFSILMLI